MYYILTLIEGVIVNSIKGVVDLYNEDFQFYKKYQHINWWDVNTWNFEECECASTEYLKTYFNQRRFFDGLEFMYYAKTIIEELAQFYPIEIVTMGTFANLQLKELWLGENIPGINMVGVNTKKYKNKSHIDMSNGIFFDDNSKNLFGSNAKEKIVYGDIYPWNEDWKGRRLANWCDIKNYLI